MSKTPNIQDIFIPMFGIVGMVVAATYVLAVLTSSTNEYMARMHVISASRAMAAVNPATQSAARELGLGKLGYSQPGDTALLGGPCYGQLRPFISGGNVVPGTKGTPGINPTLACRLVKLFSDYQCAKIISGYRSYATQKNMCGAGRSGCAPPGRSCHQYGLAVDIKGCTERLRKLLGKRRVNAYQLHFPYYGPHIQCIENSRAACSPRTLPCGGKSPDSSRMGQGQATVAPRSQPGQGGKQGVGGTPPGGSPTKNPSQPAKNEHPFSHDGNGLKKDDPYGIWSATSTATSTSAAKISCGPTEVVEGESARVEWRCSSGSTRSRGGSTNQHSRLNTGNRPEGAATVQPRSTTSYKLQCLRGDKLIGESVCTVKVVGRSGGSGDPVGKSSVLHISAEKSVIEWGTSTQLQWAALGATECQVNGGRLRGVRGLEGAVDTGRLYRPTTYILECDTSKGSKIKKVEIGIK